MSELYALYVTFMLRDLVTLDLTVCFSPGKQQNRLLAKKRHGQGKLNDLLDV